MLMGGVPKAPPSSRGNAKAVKEDQLKWEIMYCSSCGQQSNEQKDNFCTRCGNALRRTSSTSGDNVWLLNVFLLILFIRPIFLFYSVGLYRKVASFVSGDMELLLALELLVRWGLAIWGTVVAVQLFAKTRNCLRSLDWMLSANLIFLAMDVFTTILILDAQVEGQDIVISLSFVIPVYLYFKLSRTVRAVYGGNV
jgi:hypothetical protein